MTPMCCEAEDAPGRATLRDPRVSLPSPRLFRCMPSYILGNFAQNAITIATNCTKSTTPVHSTVPHRGRTAVTLYLVCPRFLCRDLARLILSRLSFAMNEGANWRAILLTRASSESLRSTSRSMVHDVLRPARCLFVFVLTTSFRAMKFN